MTRDPRRDLNEALTVPTMIQHARSEGIRALERYAATRHRERLRAAFWPIDGAVCSAFYDTPATLAPSRTIDAALEPSDA